MRTATAIVIQDGNVQIVPRHTMVQVEASPMVLIVRLRHHQQQQQRQKQQQQHKQNNHLMI
jgi:hypothetical protein